MLILTREKNEKIIIGDEVWVVFLGFTDQKARLGIMAPRSLSVHREEIYYRIQLRQQKNISSLPFKD